MTNRVNVQYCQAPYSWRGKKVCSKISDTIGRTNKGTQQVIKPRQSFSIFNWQIQWKCCLWLGFSCAEHWKSVFRGVHCIENKVAIYCVYSMCIYMCDNNPIDNLALTMWRRILKLLKQIRNTITLLLIWLVISNRSSVSLLTAAFIV